MDQSLISCIVLSLCLILSMTTTSNQNARRISLCDRICCFSLRKTKKTSQSSRTSLHAPQFTQSNATRAVIIEDKSNPLTVNDRPKLAQQINPFQKLSQKELDSLSPPNEIFYTTKSGPLMSQLPELLSELLSESSNETVGTFGRWITSYNNDSSAKFTSEKLSEVDISMLVNDKADRIRGVKNMWTDRIRKLSFLLVVAQDEECMFKNDADDAIIKSRSIEDAHTHYEQDYPKYDGIIIGPSLVKFGIIKFAGFLAFVRSYDAQMGHASTLFVVLAKENSEHLHHIIFHEMESSLVHPFILMRLSENNTVAFFDRL